MDGQPDFGALRLLIVGAKAHSSMILRTALSVAGAKDVTIVSSGQMALELLCRKPFDAVFCDDQAKPIDRVPFALAARRTPGVLNPLMPIFCFSEAPRKRSVEAERDRGITDVIALPVTAATVTRKLRAALENPRCFIKTGSYFGPDRRGNARPPFEGSNRRDTPEPNQPEHGNDTSRSDKDTVFL